MAPSSWSSRLPSSIRAAALVLIALGAALAALVASGAPGLLTRAYLYGLPAYEVARARDAALTKQGQALNALVHKRELADAQTRLITTPNNDTLYSSAFLDLSRGPVVIDVPVFGDRYYSLAFIDAYTNNFAIVGQRTIGGGGARLRVVPDDWKGEAEPGETLVRAPTPQIWLLVRILIDGPKDLDAVHKLQDALVVKGPAESSFPPDAAPAEANGPDFVRVVNQVLRDNPPPEADQAELAALRGIGIGADAPPLTFWQNLIWRVGFPVVRQGLIRATAGGADPVEGWIYTRPTIGDFGVDYPYRAAVALRGLLALPEKEAIYTRPVSDQKSRPLESGHRYRLRLPPGAPPVKGFWSLTAYRIEADGGLYFADNPIHRYSVGDRTDGLVRNADGGVDIFIQREKPEGAEAANWLPIPDGPFVLIQRAYLPGEDFLAGRFRYPPIERLDE
jgi:hypothetical protein